MSMRTPPRGRGPQRPAQPTKYKETRPVEPPRKRGRAFDIVILLAIVALVVLLIKSLTGSIAAGSPGASAKPGVSGSPGAAASGASATSLPVISEIMPANKGTITASDGKYYDWIEIYNPTQSAISLAGFALSDNIQKPDKFVFPTYRLEPGQFAIVFASGGKSTNEEFQAPFKLGSSGEQLIFSDPDGHEIQRLSYPSVEPNASYACDMGDLKKWAVSKTPTPGFPNTKEGYAAYKATRFAKNAQPLMNEVMAGNTISFKDGDGEFSDWLELYNSSDKAIDLSGYGLSNKEDEPKRWVFPDTTKLEPKKYMIIYLSGKNRAVAGKELHTDFRLNAYQDVLLLSDKRGLILQEIKISKMDNDTSFGAVPGTTDWKTFTHPTPGQPNTEDGFNALQPLIYGNQLGDVIINEVMPVNNEKLKDQFDEYPAWIELYNRSSKAINLKGYALTDKSDELGRWALPDMQLGAGEYLTIFADGKNLKDADAVSKKKLHADFSLSASGDLVVLTTPDGKLADRCLLPAMQSGITYGRPAGKVEFKYITNPTPDAANPDGYPGYAPDPIFSMKAGQYSGPQQVTLSTGDDKSKIYYTTDCTTPKQSSTQYGGAISMQKTTVVRAIAYRDGYLPSRPVCSTYLIDEKINLPIVSIVSDPANLFDEQTGIYANGPGWTEKVPHTGANYWKDWERLAHVELVEPDGTVGLSQDFGLKIYGQYSRANDQKSFALIARNSYGSNSFDYQIFPDLPYTSYKSFIVRNSAQDANMSRIRTALQVGLAAETSDVDHQSSRQSIVFVNGQFWGVYDIMEKINEHFLSQHNNIDPTKVDLLEGNGAVKYGSNKEYKDLINYVKTHDLSNQANYNYVASKVDIDNYIDWCCIEIYTVNSDLGNVRFWKPQTPDGKWRWILYDLDWGFYFLHQNQTAEYYNDPFAKFLNPKGNGVSNMFDNSLIRGLLKNPGFREKFIERFVYHSTVTFETNRVLARIDELSKNIEPYMARDKEKWDQGTMTSWQKQLDLLRNFAKQRPEMNLHYLQQYFNLSDAQMDQLMKKK